MKIMAKRGPKPTTQPKLGYDYRRYIALVQVLAADGSDDGIRHLCAAWDVEPVEDRSEPPYQGRYYLNVWATIRKLAQHVIEYHQDER